MFQRVNYNFKIPFMCLLKVILKAGVIKTFYFLSSNSVIYNH